MAISIGWLWLKTRGRDQTSISPRPTSLADPSAACRFASKPESSSPALARSWPTAISMAEDSWKGPNQYISQAYVFGRPFGSLPIRIEAGKFFTSVGAELAQSDRDFNTSRSLISWYGSPLYHVGIGSSAPITERFTIGAQLLSGCNTTGGAHGHQSMAYTAAWAGKHWSWSQLYMGGNEKLVGRGWRQLSDTVFTLNPSTRIL